MQKTAQKDLVFFLHFCGAIAYLKQELWEMLTQANLIQVVAPGTHTTLVNRKWFITGIQVEDQATIHMNGSIYLDCEIGHPADYSMMICYGQTTENDDGPFVVAYWITPMIAWKPPESYYLTRGAP